MAPGCRTGQDRPRSELLRGPFRLKLQKMSLLLSTEGALRGFLLCLFKKKFFLMLIFDRENVSGGGAERETHTESKAASRLPAASTEPDVRLELTSREIMT